MRLDFDWSVPALVIREPATEKTMTFGPAKTSYRCISVSKAIVAFTMICLLGSGMFGLVQSVTADEQLTSGSSSKQFRLQTVSSIPFQQLNAKTRDKITGILEKPSMYRRLPITAINADPDHFRFLVRYPEVIVNIWQLMGVTKMETERTGPYSIKCNDGAGTISSLELVYGTDKFHIFYGTGSYEGPILKRKLTGECVLVLRSESQKGNDGKLVQTSQLDVFLKVNNATAGLIARTIQPLVGNTADHNFVESLKFVQRLNETTEKNGPGVQQMSKKLDLDPNVRQKYNDVVDLVFQRAINNSAPGPNRSTTPQPARTLNSSHYANPQMLNPGRSQPTYPPQPQSKTSQYTIPIQPTQPNTNLIPAHGYQAPVYGAKGVNRSFLQSFSDPMANPTYPQRAYSSAYGQSPNQAAIQAQYQNYRAANGTTNSNQVEKAGGWRGR